MNKRGLNNIITTVLIILLVLAAITILWGFIRNLLNESTEGVRFDDFSTTLEVVPQSVGFLSHTPNTIKFVVRKNAGGQDVVAYYATLEDNDGKLSTKRVPDSGKKDPAMEDLQIDSNIRNYVDEGLSGVHKIILTPVYMLNGKEVTSKFKTEYIVTVDAPITGLIAWWRFDETSGTSINDSSGNGNDGILFGGNPETRILGISNRALYFDGATKIETNYVQNAVSEYTISAWVRIPSGQTGQNIIVQDRGEDRGEDSGHSLTLGVDNGRFFFADDSMGILIGKKDTQSVNDGSWHYLVGVWRGAAGTAISPSQFSLYLDGKLLSVTENQEAGLDAHPIAPLEGLDGTQIGYHQAWDAYFHGAIDDVRVYNRALSFSEISDIYESQKP